MATKDKKPKNPAKRASSAANRPAPKKAAPEKNILQKAGDAIGGAVKNVEAGYAKLQKSRTDEFNDYYNNLKKAK
jgi:hypothetical protein